LKIQSKCKTASKHQSKKVKKLAREAYKISVQIDSLLAIQNRLDGLQQLNVKMKNTDYFKESITHSEITEACRAIANNDNNREIGKGKKAVQIMWVMITLNLLFSKIPILRELVEKTLSKMPDINRDIVLQKSMLNTNLQLTDFRLAVAGGNKLVARAIALKLYKTNSRIIDHHLSMCLITKKYELDHFLKKIWIINESYGLFNDANYSKMVSEALQCIRSIQSNRCQVKVSAELITQLELSLNNIKAMKGW
jgi:hypothetical protein